MKGGYARPTAALRSPIDWREALCVTGSVALVRHGGLQHKLVTVRGEAACVAVAEHLCREGVGVIGVGCHGRDWRRGGSLDGLHQAALRQ